MTKVCVVLPAYNEEDNIGVLIEQIVQMSSTIPHPVSIVVIDDGSTDGTVARIEALSCHDRVRVVRHAKNQGLSRTLNTGLQTALNDADAADLLITLDADNTQDPKFIPRMIDTILQGHDVVIASRFAASGEEVGVPRLRQALSHGASWVFRVLFPMRNVRDYTCGYRAYRREILEKAYAHYGDRFIEAKGFGVMTEVLLKLRRFAVRCDEVGFVLRYDLKGGQSKLRLGPTLLDYLAVMCRNLTR